MIKIKNKKIELDTYEQEIVNLLDENKLDFSVSAEWKTELAKAAELHLLLVSTKRINIRIK